MQRQKAVWDITSSTLNGPNSSLHLELLESVHVKISCFQPDFVSCFPWSEPGCDSLLHLLLGNLVGSLGIVPDGRQVQ